jgi:2-succinyl-5-enolpyruvyl-6-hydroxy-3-cyclohexene-1-carboxylate synthase
MTQQATQSWRPVRAWITIEEDNEFVKSLSKRKEEEYLILTDSERERLIDIWLQNPGYHYIKNNRGAAGALAIAGL